MESTLASSTATLSFPIRLSCAAKAFAPPLLPFCLPNPSRYPLVLHSSNSFASLGYLCSVLPVARSPFSCISNSPSLFAYGGGGGGGGGGGTDGGGGSEGGDSNKSADAAEYSSDVSALSPDLIVLHVGGMTCGGCAASVKRILESQPQVSSASVNLTSETAIVWPVPEAPSFPNWRKQLGELLAKHLTNCGFTSNLHGQRVQERYAEL